LRHLIIECAFPNEDERLAVVSKHLSPRRLASELAHLQRDCSLHITHLKPGRIELTMHQVAAALQSLQPLMLQNNQVFEF
jgi:cAMP phosphodiesterase